MLPRTPNRLAGLVAAALVVACRPAPAPLPESADNGFSFNRHSLPFANFAGDFNASRMTPALAARMFGPDTVCVEGTLPCRPLPVATQWVEDVNRTLDAGRSEGFAVLSLLLYLGRLDPQDFGGQAAGDLKLQDNHRLQAELAYLSATQRIRTVQEQQRRFAAKDVMPFLAEVLQPGQPEAWRLAVAQVGQGGFRAGHALVPMGYVRGNREGLYLLRVYDSNFPTNERRLEIDVKANHWRYEGSDDPEAPLTYEGTPENGNLLYFSPVTQRLGVLPCPFAPDAPALSASSHGDVSLGATSDSAQVGFEAGRPVEAGGGLVLPGFSACTCQPPAANTTYSLPSDGGSATFTITDTGSSQTPGTVSVTGPNLGATVTNIRTGDGAADTLQVSNGGQTLTYQTQQPSDAGVTLRLAVNTDAGTVYVEVQVNGPASSVTVDTAADGGIRVSTEGSPPGTVVSLTITEGEGSQQTLRSEGYAVSDGGSGGITAQSDGGITLDFPPPDPCTNGVLDTDWGERDVDCGGRNCRARCGEGLLCGLDPVLSLPDGGLAGDCADGLSCSPMVYPYRCRAAGCDDGLLNGNETDFNCGGSCPACRDGDRCKVAADCQSGLCVDLAPGSDAGADVVRCVSRLRVQARILGLPTGLSVGLAYVIDGVPGTTTVAGAGAASAAWATLGTGYVVSASVSAQPQNAQCAVTSVQDVSSGYETIRLVDVACSSGSSSLWLNTPAKDLDWQWPSWSPKPLYFKSSCSRLPVTQSKLDGVVTSVTGPGNQGDFYRTWEATITQQPGLYVDLGRRVWEVQICTLTDSNATPGTTVERGSYDGGSSVDVYYWCDCEICGGNGVTARQNCLDWGVSKGYLDGDGGVLPVHWVLGVDGGLVPAAAGGTDGGTSGGTDAGTPATYTVTYDPRGGSACSPATQVVTLGAPYGALCAPTRTGFTFAGWSTASSQGTAGVAVTSSSTVTTAANHTLVAAWTANTYAVSFDNQGGAGCTSTTVTFDSRYGTLCTPTRTGYTFSGWRTASGGSGTLVDANTFVTTASNHSLYAEWGVNNYTVTYDSQGGSTCSPASKTVTFGGTYGPLCAPTRNGYTFGGWYTAPNGAGSVVSATTPFALTSDQSLYARWTANLYTVTYDSQGGMACVPATTSVTFGQAYGPLCTTLRSGYTFAGWFTGPNGTADAVGASSTVNTGANHTLYAAWTANTYTVTYDSQGGTACSPGTRTVTFGLEYGTLCNPSRSGYTFDGWKTAAGASGSLVLGASLVSTASNHTLYASWTSTTGLLGAACTHDSECTTQDCECGVNSGECTGNTGKCGAGRWIVAAPTVDSVQPSSTFTVPADCDALFIEAWGAAGGSATNPSTAYTGGTVADPGAAGGHAWGTLAVTANDEVRTWVGEGGGSLAPTANLPRGSLHGTPALGGRGADVSVAGKSGGYAGAGGGLTSVLVQGTHNHAFSVPGGAGAGYPDLNSNVFPPTAGGSSYAGYNAGGNGTSPSGASAGLAADGGVTWAGGGGAGEPGGGAGDHSADEFVNFVPARGGAFGTLPSGLTAEFTSDYTAASPPGYAQPPNRVAPDYAACRAAQNKGTGRPGPGQGALFEGASTLLPGADSTPFTYGGDGCVVFRCVAPGSGTGGGTGGGSGGGTGSGAQACTTDADCGVSADCECGLSSGNCAGNSGKCGAGKWVFKDVAQSAAPASTGVLPASCGTVFVQAWGAAGGGVTNVFFDPVAGGAGGFVSGQINGLSSGLDQLDVWIGQGGEANATLSSNAPLGWYAGAAAPGGLGNGAGSGGGLTSVEVPGQFGDRFAIPAGAGASTFDDPAFGGSWPGAGGDAQSGCKQLCSSRTGESADPNLSGYGGGGAGDPGGLAASLTVQNDKVPARGGASGAQKWGLGYSAASTATFSTPPQATSSDYQNLCMPQASGVPLPGAGTSNGAGGNGCVVIRCVAP